MTRKKKAAGPAQMFSKSELPFGNKKCYKERSQ
jgi:hypothetical protein